MDYWFYLEPYTFLLRSENKVVIYNTLNSAYIVCPKHPTVEHIIEEWEDAANGYGVLLSRETIADENVKRFIDDVRESFSGDCIEHDSESLKPYHFKPTLFLNSDIRIKEEKSRISLGNRVLQNLHEVTLYFPASCSRKCTACNSYSRQMNHCMVCPEGTMKLEEYIHLLRQLQIGGIQRLNMSGGGNPIQNSYVCKLLADLAEYGFKKHLYMDLAFLSDEYIKLAKQVNVILEVSVSSEYLNEQLIKVMHNYPYDFIHWNLLVSEDADMDCLESLKFPETSSVLVRPFYTGNNLSFFQNYVFIDLQDILAVPVSRKAIFRHKVVNDNFFGKLTIFPSGEVYANVNCPPLGNIRDFSLKELVYKELTEHNVWLRIRGNETPCNQCVNRDLCPSVSDYELVIGKNNLCNIQPG